MNVILPCPGEAPRGGPACYESAVADLSDVRARHLAAGLAEGDLAADPMTQFRAWHADYRALDLPEPDAMVVVTVGADGAPSARMVLLKRVNDAGFTFFTNYRSRKAAELAADPRVALHFPWPAVARQVIVEGVAERVAAAESDAYFASRPRGSQLGAWASPQSRVVGSRAELAASYAAAERRFAGGEVPRPPHWGGLLVRPHRVEFWAGRPDRLHDRLRYVAAAGGGWVVERLAP